MAETPNAFEYKVPMDTKNAWPHTEKKPSQEKKVGSFERQLKEFSAATSGHGFVYLGEDGRPPFERIFWCLCIIGGFVLMFVFIQPIYEKWQLNPTITSPASTNYPIWNVYFPAVTICSNNKVVEAQMDTVLKRDPWKNLTYVYPDLKASLMKAISNAILFETEPHLLKDDEIDATAKELLIEYKKDIPKAMQQVMHTCKDMIIMCLWQGELVNCTDIFEVRRTDNGYCCSFNTLRMSEQFVSPSEINAGIEEEVDYYDYYYYYNNYDGGYSWDWYSWSSSTEDPESITEATTEDTTDGATGETTQGEPQGSTNDPNQETTIGKDQGTTGSDPIGSTNQEPEGPNEGSTTTQGSTDETTEATSEAARKRRKRSTTSAEQAKKKPQPTKLKRTNAANAMLGLTVILNPNEAQYSDVVMNNFIGFKGLVHSPFDFAEVGGKGFAIEKGREVFVAIGATFTSSSDKVKSMPLEKRKCLKHDEDMTVYPDIILEAFKNYSRKACLVECKARQVFLTCGCLPYYYPDFSNLWQTDTTCDLNGLRCLANVSSQSKALQPSSSDDATNIEDLIQGTQCNCPLDCEETIYTQELSQAITAGRGTTFSRLKAKDNYLWKLEQTMSNTTNFKKLEKLQRLYNDILNSSSLVHFYFKETGIVQYTREELYGVMDLVAAFGGIIGLCSGFSLLSGVEIIYWFTIRYFFDKFKSSKKIKE